MNPATRKLRCAIYTRKSTEEGLEQNYNSLDAQRMPVSRISPRRSQKAGWPWTTPTTMADSLAAHSMFKNPVFIGVAAYKGQHFAGEHDAILDRALWEQVQAMLGRGEPEQRARQNRPSRAPALLKGLIFADDGRATTPGATQKGDKVYRYYVNTASMKIGKDACSVSRVPAGEIEAAVIAQVRKVLQAPEVMSQAIREVVALDPAADAQRRSSRRCSRSSQCGMNCSPPSRPGSFNCWWNG